MNNNSKNIILSIITPAYNEDKNIPQFYTQLSQVLSPLSVKWEWIIVDDHSSDSTFLASSEIAKNDHRVKVFRFSRNFGSHSAIACGLTKSQGKCAVVLAADLQDPPEIIPKLLDKWGEENTQIIWAVRTKRDEINPIALRFSNLYYWIMRKFADQKNLPPSGADFFLIDRKVIDVYLQFNEKNNNIFVQLAWLGFRQEHLYYIKKARINGVSNWTISKKIKLALDSFISYSYAPIRMFSLTGFVTASLGFIYAIVLFFRALFVKIPVEGWSALMIVILIIGGFQMAMLGILGEYLWRALDQTRNRPNYIIETEFINNDQKNR